MKDKVISFDLDGTIVKPDYNEFVWFEEIPRLYAAKHKIELEKAKKIVEEEYRKVGEDDIRWYILGFWLKHFGLEVEEKEVLEKYSHVVEVYHDAKVALARLSGVYPLIICSAMPHNFIEVKLRKESLFAYFKKIFSAVSDFNMTKKDSSFYLEVCRRMQISPSQLVHVGDNYQADYLAPSKVGVRAFFLDRINSRKEGKLRIVSNLIEFVEQIERA